MNWHQMDAAAVAAALHVDVAHGLTASEAASRLGTHGPNALHEHGGRSPWTIVHEQLTATMVVILLVAAVASLAIGDLRDAAVILLVVVLNGGLGFFQEYRADRAMDALARLAVPHARVRRDGAVVDIPSRALVPGDVVLIEAGGHVSADGRVVESASLLAQEAALTGEAETVLKITEPVGDEAAPLGDRRDMVFMGTRVTQGRGVVIVTETGMRTELGRIAGMLRAVEEEPTPLQRRLDQLGRRLAAVALAIVAVIFTLGLARGEALGTMFLTAVSMAVAAVPEGLPAVVTIALALGAQRMLGRRALVRRLSAVETLGSVTVICSDKTGTLTQNRMTLAVIELADRAVPVDAAAPAVTWPADAPLAALLSGVALCNDALAETGASPIGDPTEVALLQGAAGFGLNRSVLERELPRVDEVPFDSDRKRMSTVHALPAGHPLAAALRGPGGNAAGAVIFTKGAADRVLEVADRVWTAAGIVALDASWSARIKTANDRLAGDGMRVLGLGVHVLDAVPIPHVLAADEQGLVFVGLVGIVDPPRPEAAAALEACRQAGIRSVMITGDHPLTAAYIARRLGLSEDGRVVTGAELDRLSEEELRVVVDDVRIYARVSPAHKLRLVEAFRRRGHTVAMTGDGVNDAPALERASIGVAMGQTGTDVAREAADMVLLDDNFATIVAAVEEGRVIYDNIRKFVKYLLTTNSGELLVMAVAPLFGMPLPLLPLQILWINLVTDGPTALMLGVEPAEPDVMQRPPTHAEDSILSAALVRHVVCVGLVMTAVCLAPGYWYWRHGSPAWQTMVFTTVALTQMAHVLTVRSRTRSLLQLGLCSNRPLFGTVVTAIGLHAVLVYAPFAQRIFGTVALSAGDVGLCVGMAAVVGAAVEGEKWWRRRRGAGTHGQPLHAAISAG